MESDVPDKTDAKPSAKRGPRKRKQDPEVQVIEDGPSVRFPEYLNQAAPNDLPMMELRHHVMISQINYYNASTRFFDKATNMLPHLKRLIADMPITKGTGQSTTGNEHCYTFPSNNDSDCDV